MGRASGAQKTGRLNRARSLLREFDQLPDAVEQLAQDCSISPRQAYRYLQQAEWLKEPLVALSILYQNAPCFSFGAAVIMIQLPPLIIGFSGSSTQAVPATGTNSVATAAAAMLPRIAATRLTSRLAYARPDNQCSASGRTDRNSGARPTPRNGRNGSFPVSTRSMEISSLWRTDALLLAYGSM